MKATPVLESAKARAAAAVSSKTMGRFLRP